MKYRLTMVVEASFSDVGKIVDMAERLGHIDKLHVDGPFPDGETIEGRIEPPAEEEAPPPFTASDAPVAADNLPKSSMASNRRLQEVAHYVEQHGAEAAAAYFKIKLDTVNAYVSEWQRLLRQAEVA